jgi:hypothetical protein
VRDHEHILQRKVRAEIMLRTSSRFDFEKTNPQKTATDRSNADINETGFVFQEGETQEAQKSSSRRLLRTRNKERMQRAKEN